MSDLTGRLRALGMPGSVHRITADEAADRFEEQADKAMILKRVLASKEARIEELEARGPADIGMVPEGVKLRRGVPGQLWWRKMSDEYPEDRFIGLVQGGADDE